MKTNIFEIPEFKNKTIRSILDEVLQNEGLSQFRYDGNILNYFKITDNQYDIIIKEEFIGDIYKKAKEFSKSIEEKIIWQNSINIESSGEWVSGKRRSYITNKNGKLYDMDGDELIDDGTIILKNKNKDCVRLWHKTEEGLDKITKIMKQKIVDKRIREHKIKNARLKVTEQELIKLGYL